MKRFTTGVLVLAAGLVAVVFAPPAAADRPAISQKTMTLTSDLTGVCAFPISVVYTMTETDRFFTDSSGTLTRASATVDEQDTFSANGKSLTGMPYTVNLMAFFDSSGNISQEYATGVIERVPLPDGTVFQSAGRVNFAAQGFPSFTVTPDTGTARNLAAFCSALTP